MKTCDTCEELKPKSEFAVNRHAPDGLRRTCQACAKEWYEENRAMWAKRASDYWDTHTTFKTGE